MNFRLNFNSLTTRMMLLGVVFLIAGALGRVFLLTDYLRDDVTKLASDQLLTIANYVAQDVNHDILERRDLLTRVALRLPLALLNNQQQMQQWLAERQEMNPLFALGMFVLSAEGVVLTDSSAPADRGGLSYADRDYFQQAIKGEFAIGRPVIGRAVKVPVLPMAIPLRDADGKIMGVLVGISPLDSPNFMGTLRAAQVGSTGGLLLISPRDKLFIAASDQNLVLTATPNEGEHPQHDQAMQGFRGVAVSVRSGIEELAAIASVPASGWFVVARLPSSEAYAPVTSIRRYVLKSTAIILPIFLLVMVLVMRRVMRPLMNSAHHADRMTLGEIPLEPLPVVLNDEVGHLTAAFNRLLAKLLESRAKLDHMAHHDTLTGLPNRWLLADRMKLALARAQRNEGQIATLFLDLDGFKPINDGFGHEAGDTCLREVARRLSEALRSEDTLARVGGDEFVILLSDLREDARDSAEMVANKCLAVFEQPFLINDQSCRLGTSIGIALGDGRCLPEALLSAADHAMYQAKKMQGGRFCWAA